jgi:hypothetical protein
MLTSFFSGTPAPITGENPLTQNVPQAETDDKKLPNDLLGEDGWPLPNTDRRVFRPEISAALNSSSEVATFLETVRPEAVNFLKQHFGRRSKETGHWISSLERVRYLYISEFRHLETAQAQPVNVVSKAAKSDAQVAHEIAVLEAHTLWKAAIRKKKELILACDTEIAELHARHAALKITQK